MRNVAVALGERSYEIQIGRGLLRRVGVEASRLGFRGRCAVVTDQTVARLHADTVQSSLEKAGFDVVTFAIPSGEKSKSIAQLAACYEALARQRMERKSLVLALGGGVVGDLAGFAAASYLRGLSFIQIPTTLLAQVDSSVGGKTGINLPSGKNLVGAFHQPRLVICDLDSLTTLPDREYRAGLAEVIKYGVIYDAAFFAELEKKLPALLARKPAALERVIATCCEIKAAVVGQDENESGLRAILNYGHTVGHGLEAISKYGKYLHGEAISIGQVIAARLSEKKSGLISSDANRIEALFARAGLPTRVRLTLVEWRRLQDAMRLDKKVADGEVKFVLSPKIGEAIWGQKVGLAEIEEFVR